MCNLVAIPYTKSMYISTKASNIMTNRRKRECTHITTSSRNIKSTNQKFLCTKGIEWFIQINLDVRKIKIHPNKFECLGKLKFIQINLDVRRIHPSSWQSHISIDHMKVSRQISPICKIDIPSQNCVAACKTSVPIYRFTSFCFVDQVCPTVVHFVPL